MHFRPLQNSTPLHLGEKYYYFIDFLEQLQFLVALCYIIVIYKILLNICIKISSTPTSCNIKILLVHYSATNNDCTCNNSQKVKFPL